MSIDYDKESPNIQRRIRLIIRTIFRAAQSLTFLKEFRYGSYAPNSGDEINTLHCINHQFFLAVSISKLFEYARRKDDAESSLIALFEKLSAKYSNEFKHSDEVEQLVLHVTSDETFIKLRLFRDKVYAHSDKHLYNLEHGFLFLTQGELDYCHEIISNSIEIFNRCYTVYGRTFGFHNAFSSSPRTYLRTNFVAREFFYKYGRFSMIQENLQAIDKAIISIEEGKNTDKALEVLKSLKGQLSEMIDFPNSIIKD